MFPGFLLITFCFKACLFTVFSRLAGLSESAIYDGLTGPSGPMYIEHFENDREYKKQMNCQMNELLMSLSLIH